MLQINYYMKAKHINGMLWRCRRVWKAKRTTRSTAKKPQESQSFDISDTSSADPSLSSDSLSNGKPLVRSDYFWSVPITLWRFNGVLASLRKFNRIGRSCLPIEGFRHSPTTLYLYFTPASSFFTHKVCSGSKWGTSTLVSVFSPIMEWWRDC